MRSNNPIFANADGFNGRNVQGNVTVQGNGNPYAGYGDPSTWGTGTPGVPGPTHAPGRPASGTGRMTIDSVVQKTGLTLVTLLVTAAATWVLSPTIGPENIARFNAIILISAGAAFVLSLVNSFMRTINPTLVLVFAAAEGVVIGAVSKGYAEAFGPGVVTNAVLGTVAAFAGTLAAYKFFHIKVGDRFRRGVVAAMFGFVGLSMLDLVLGLFGHSFGFNGISGPVAIFAGVAGVLIAVLMLILDFDFVERGVANGLPERESWRAAFGLTVTLVWIYMNLLRLLAIFTRR